MERPNRLLNPEFYATLPDEHSYFRPQYGSQASSLGELNKNLPAAFSAASYSSSSPLSPPTLPSSASSASSSSYFGDYSIPSPTPGQTSPSYFSPPSRSYGSLQSPALGALQHPEAQSSPLQSRSPEGQHKGYHYQQQQRQQQRHQHLHQHWLPLEQQQHQQQFSHQLLLPPHLPETIQHANRELPETTYHYSPLFPSPYLQPQPQPQLRSPEMGSSSRARPEAKRMTITSLLSEEAGSGTTTAEETTTRTTAEVVPGPAPEPAPSEVATAAPLAAPSKYRIHVRQQPMAARSCGFGERDRRVIDPPPIVQLSIEDPAAAPEQASSMLRCQFSVLYCSIWDETGLLDSSTMPDDYRQQRRLMGTVVSSPFVGLDEHGAEGCFFCFPDLSCRTPGAFRLKFNLVVLDPLNMRPGSSSPVLATTLSDVFTVYSAKEFPGMQASTPLTRRLREQGCLISIKKGYDKSNPSSSRGGREESGNDDINR